MGFFLPFQDKLQLQHLFPLQTSLNTYWDHKPHNTYCSHVLCLLLSDNGYIPPGSFLEGCILPDMNIATQGLANKHLLN